MKIQKLVITGFGPYASRQELDFEKNLQHRNMFVITGNTGAGKTTIFDAINFALYGEASGSDREGKSLRSDFADSQTPTEVELWFSLRGKEYYVKRTPAYMKPKQRGEGFVENKPTAEIKLSKDKTVTGANQVTKEIEGILGITTEQFKQLVMIPQGEFKRLLNAKSEEKEDIFRKIFGTEVFESIQKQIREQANKLRRGIEQVERDRLSKIRSFICKEKDEELFQLISSEDVNIELIMKKFYEFIEEDKEEQKKAEEGIKGKTHSIDKLSREITLGEAINKKFESLEKNKKELAALNEILGEYENKKHQVGRGKKALTVKNYEEKYDEKNRVFKRLDFEIKEIEKNIKNFKENFIKLEQQFNEQKSKEEEKNQLLKSIEENKRLKDRASAYEKNKKDVEALEKKVEEIKNRITTIHETAALNEEQIKLIGNELEEIKKLKDEKGRLEIEKIKCESKQEKIKSLSMHIASWKQVEKVHKEARNVFDELEKEFKISKERYEFLEDTFRKNQAGILARELLEGTPCPVCGSIHHPDLARLENSEITEEAVKESKEALEKVRTKRDKKLNELTDYNTSLKSLKDTAIAPLAAELLNKEECYEVMDIASEANELSQTNAALIKELNRKINCIMEVVNKENEKIQARELMEKNNGALREELQLKNNSLAEEEGNLRAAKNTLEIIINEFKGEIKSAAELEKTTKVLSEKLQTLKRAYEESEKAFSLIKSKLDEEMGRYKNSSQTKEKTKEELEEAIRVFKDSVLALGFKGYEDYKASSLTEEKLENIEKEINDFNLKLAGAQKLYEASLKDIEGLSIINLDTLKETLVSENNLLKALNDQRMNIFSRITNNTSILHGCDSYNKGIEKDEKKYRIVGKLSNVVNGENSKKISFERYVLAAYFEDIIAAANVRFTKMTSGRFELLRKQDIGDKRKGQGLDLEVFDNYTGKSRDVKTLSGGESFKASLAMALGLADVVQAYAGGIQLDTMFIDEGFGTLDPESLDNAIECLMDLQNDGRLVGIISHVPELKERINARLVVSSTNKGSMAEFRV